MPFYSDELIEEVRSRNDIVDVIGQSVQLKKNPPLLFRTRKKVGSVWQTEPTLLVMSSPISEALFYVSDAGALFRPAVDDAIQTKNVAKGGSGAASRCRHAAVTLLLRCYCVSSVFFSCEMIFFSRREI